MADLFHIAFYKFAHIAEPADVADRLRELTQELRGSILIANEGINGMLAGSSQQMDAFEAAVQADSAADAVLAGLFKGMLFKRTACLTQPFKRMKVHWKKEIVPLGVEGVDAPGRIDEIHANDVPPEQWRELIKRPDVVLLDNRNSFEYRLGKFEGAIDPGVINFRDFPEYVKAHAPQWKSEGKTVAMYCTGGIRCEKASALFRRHGFKSVYQLHGGIMTYQQEFGNEHWLGECFVFDQRMTVRVEEGLTQIGRCAHSGRPTSRFVNCLHDPCHQLFILSTEAESENPDHRLCPPCLARGLTSETAEYKRSAAASRLGGEGRE